MTITFDDIGYFMTYKFVPCLPEIAVVVFGIFAACCCRRLFPAVCAAVGALVAWKSYYYLVTYQQIATGNIADDVVIALILALCPLLIAIVHTAILTSFLVIGAITDGFKTIKTQALARATRILAYVFCFMLGLSAFMLYCLAKSCYDVANYYY